MGRRSRTNSADRIHRKIAQGRGQGSKESYKPGIYTYEIPSKGKVARIKGYTTGRVHHCLSQHEKNFFITLDYDPEVTDIREQFLLDMESTLLIAAGMGVEHPRADGYPIQMTTDFFYCKNSQWYAVAIKTTEDLKKQRTREKLEIEKRYWENRGIPWRIVTEQDIPRQKVINLQWLHSGEQIEKLVPDPDFRQKLTDAFLELYQDYTIPFEEIVNTIESYCHLAAGTVLQLFKYLILSNAISVNYDRPIYLAEPRTLP